MWHGGQEVLAVAYDVMVPGYDTASTNNLRLWESKPQRGFDLNSFNGMRAFHGTFSFIEYHVTPQPVITKALLKRRTVLPLLLQFSIPMIIRASL